MKLHFDKSFTRFFSKNRQGVGEKPHGLRKAGAKKMEEFNIDFIKGFLHVDFDDDDGYIHLITEGAKEYITNAVGEYNEESALCRLLALAIISEMYEKRMFSADGTAEKSYIIKSMIEQLRLKRECEED